MLGSKSQVAYSPPSCCRTILTKATVLYTTSLIFIELQKNKYALGLFNFSFLESSRLQDASFISIYMTKCLFKYN